MVKNYFASRREQAVVVGEGEKATDFSRGNSPRYTDEEMQTQGGSHVFPGPQRG